MRPLTSCLLDLLRISAAVGVVLSHTASDSFGQRSRLLESAGHACVAVFFVLSGYVIAWVTATREADLRTYAVARLSRIYSVLIPALVLTAVLDALSYRLDPDFFRTIVLPSNRGAVSYVRSLLFLNQTYGTNYDPGSNSPIWSLGYEVPFYAAFAVMAFARGVWQVVGIAVLLIVEGPAIWILLPVWLMGVALYSLIGRRPPARSSAVLAGIGIACLAAVSPLLAGVQTRFYGFKDTAPVEFGHSDQFVIFYTIGLFVCFLICLVDAMSETFGTRLAAQRKFIAYCAGSTFSIYLFHYPVLVFVYSATHYDRSNAGAVVMAFIATITACVLLSYGSERQKGVWRRMVSRSLRLVGWS